MLREAQPLTLPKTIKCKYYLSFCKAYFTFG